MIGFAGLSHLGIVSSIVAATKGFEVIAFDARAQLAAELSARMLPILEPELPQKLQEAEAQIRFTSNACDLASCQVIYIALDVTTDDANRSELAAVEKLVETVVPHLPPQAVMVVLSQVPPGFTRSLRHRLNASLARTDIQLFCQVETLVFGRAVERAAAPERYIVGCENAEKALPDDYAAFLARYRCPIFPMRYESAELAKITINVFLAASVSATNTVADLCESVGADWREIAPTLRLDRRIGPHAYLLPGLGIGGGNIERDLVTVTRLAAEFGSDDAVVASFLEYSRNRRNWTMRALYRHVLKDCDNPVLAMWGLAYKPNTRSTKNSPSLQLLEALSGVRVRLYDPEAKLPYPLPCVDQVSSALEACDNADALLIMTAWEEFGSISPASVRELLARPCVIDPSGIWNRHDPRAEGLEYATLGRA